MSHNSSHSCNRIRFRSETNLWKSPRLVEQVNCYCFNYSYFWATRQALIIIWSLARARVLSHNQSTYKRENQKRWKKERWSDPKALDLNSFRFVACFVFVIHLFHRYSILNSMFSLMTGWKACWCFCAIDQ